MFDDRITVPMKIFESPNVKQKLDKIFEETKECFQNRFYEIKDFITNNKDNYVNYDSVTFDNVLTRLKKIIFKRAITVAVEKTFSTKENDFEKNLIEELTIEYVQSEIQGYAMIDAFSSIIEEIPSNFAGLRTFSERKLLKQYMILQIEKEFSGQYREGEFYAAYLETQAKAAIRQLESEEKEATKS
ncbi:MAG: hypothetical protein IKE01_01160 [Clostridia bacterium]|nr:hypothetical protein [Clostridia bacterium]